MPTRACLACAPVAMCLTLSVCLSFSNARRLPVASFISLVHPWYAIIGMMSTNASVRVNFGSSPFKYAPANAHRGGGVEEEKEKQRRAGKNKVSTNTGPEGSSDGSRHG